MSEDQQCQAPDEGERLKRIFDHWGEIQANIKDAELFGEKVVLPALNELRYASRILVATLLKIHYDKNVDINDETKSFTETENAASGQEATNRSSHTASERMAIVEQYLINADHDVLDGVLAYLIMRTNALNSRFGQKALVEQSSEYQYLIESIEKAKVLVVESRRDISKRQNNYLEIKQLIGETRGLYNQLIKTEIYASLQVEKERSELEKANRKIKRYNYAFIVSAVVALLVVLVWNLQ